jgi:hypothetical protein
MKRNEKKTPLLIVAPALLAVLVAAGCTPTVQVQAPDKPIEINMNIKIDQEVRVKVDKDLDDAIMDDPALFGVSPDKAAPAQ